MQGQCSTELSYRPILNVQIKKTPSKAYFEKKLGGDPSAGSPTDTL